MNSRERLLMVLRGGQPDRVPVTIYEYSRLDNSWANREASYVPLLELERRYGDSFVWAPFEPSLTHCDPDAVRVSEEKRTDGAIVRTVVVNTPKGPLRSVSRRDPGLMTYWQIEPLIKSDQDIERVLSLPDRPAEVDVRRIRELEARAGNDGILAFGLGDALGQVVGLFDFEDFATRCHTDDGPIRALLEKAQALVLRFVAAVGAVAEKAVFRLWGPEYCGAPLLNPAEYFRRYVVEPDTEVTAAIHASNNFSVVHCHGRLRDILDMIAETGADALEPLETLPMTTADVTLAEIKQRVGDRMCLMGTVQALTLETGTPEEMRSSVRRAIDDAAGGGRFVLLPTSAPFMIPLDPRCLANAEAMYQAAHEYGRYDGPRRPADAGANAAQAADPWRPGRGR
jgi:hypothetical protein